MPIAVILRTMPGEHVSLDGRPWQFRRQHVHLLDRRRLREELASLGHQCGGDAAGQVGLASGLVGEGVEDAERARSELDREPGGRRRLLLHDRETAAQEVGDLRLLSWFRLELDEKRYSDHA